MVNPDAGDNLGNHNLATGTGAGGGAIAGAAVGAIGGPIGMAVGAAVDAIAGGAVGQGVAKMLNPVEEDAYWRGSYVHETYVKPGMSYGDYAPAYRLGYTGSATHRGEFAA